MKNKYLLKTVYFFVKFFSVFLSRRIITNKIWFYLFDRDEIDKIVTELKYNASIK